MFVTYLLFLLIILYLSPQTSGDRLLRTDYYESFSNPIKCLVVSHFHVNGPQILFVTFNYKAYRYNNMTREDSWNIFFKKINRKCHNSIIAIKRIMGLKKIKFRIQLYLDKYQNMISNIEYIFYNDIRLGDFQLWDLNEHFSVIIEILSGVEESSDVLYSEFDIQHYLNSISTIRGDLCIETRYTGPIVLSPEYVHEKPNGLITNLEFNVQTLHIVENHKYSAFECNKTQLYPNKTVFLIVDNDNFYIKLNAVAVTFSEGRKIERKYEFKLPYAKLIYVKDIGMIPENSEKVYLVTRNLEVILCKDGTRRVAFKSIDGIIYHVEECMLKKITPYFSRKLVVSHPLEDHC